MCTCSTPSLTRLTLLDSVSRTLSRIATEAHHKLRVFDFVRGTGTMYKMEGVPIRTIFNDAMKQTGRGLLTPMWMLLIGAHVLDRERMDTLMDLIGALKTNDR